MLGTVLLRDGVVDLAARRVWRSGRVASLTGSEVEVLALLARRPGQIVDRQELLVRALGHGRDSVSRAVDVCVFRLRSKLERDPAQPVHLITAQGEGYRLVPADAVEEVRTNVVPSRAPMLGRDALLAELTAAVAEGPVALVGPAGAGKTRLALAIAEQGARGATPAGSWWVDVADLGADDLLGAVAAACGLIADTAEGLAAALRARGPTLVVLDTCERVPDAAGAFAQALSAGASVVLTSRVEVPGARTLPVGPLGPGEAALLLVDRARAGGAVGALDPGAVARLVEAVDRLPLALELAAARLSALPLARVEQELARPLRLLRDRAGEGRGASVESSLRWSWDLLSEPQRDALVRLAAFRGPIPPEAARAALGPDATDRVGALLATHLVREVPGGVAPWHAVRELAVALGDPEVRSAGAEAHLGWFGPWAAERVVALWGPDYAAALAALERHEADLRVALERADPERAAPLALALGELDFERGRYAPAAERAAATLAGLPDDHPLQTSLLTLQAGAIGRLGRWPEAGQLASLALARARTPSDRVEAGQCHAVALARTFRVEESHEAAHRAVAAAGDDPRLRARALGAVVLVSFHGAPAEVEPWARLALDAAIEGRVERLIPIARHNLAAVASRAGRLDEAEHELREAVRALGPRHRTAGIAWLNLVMILIERDPVATLDACERGLEAFRDCGAVDGVRVMLGLAGVARALLGQPVDALADLDESVALLGDGVGPPATQVRAVRAATLAMLGHDAEARDAWASVAPDLARHLEIEARDALTLAGAWVDGVRPDAGFVERLGRVRGHRRWLHLVLLRHGGRVGPALEA